jgi:hypothetical protein
MSYNQKESVYAGVSAFLSETGRESELDAGQAITLNKDERKTVIEMIAVAAMNGEMEMKPAAKAKYSTLELMRGYVNGLLSNWLRKDTRLNGDTPYVTKNPGSRAGQGDDTIKNLKALKATLTEPEHIAAVDAEIQKRFEELRTAKTKQVQIDVSKLPESVRNLFIRS